MSDDDIARAERARTGNPFFNTAQAGHYLGLSARFLERMRRRGEGPAYRRHARYVLYHIDDLIAWSQATSSGGRDD